MSKKKKVVLIVLICFLSLIISFAIYVFAVTYNVSLDKNKLIKEQCIIEVFDKDDNLIDNINIGNESVPLIELNEYTKNAFIAIEDKRFYKHNGIDFKGIIRASINNLASFSFKEGASTISQQLIKNTHLSNDKTLNRKFKELKLALELENKYTKNEILEMYLNNIYFGNNSYGIQNASKNYFNKDAKNLTISESALLAGIIKAPTYYSPINNIDVAIKRRNTVLTAMLNENYITNDEYNIALNEKIQISNIKSECNLFFTMLKDELTNTLIDNPYSLISCKIFTSYDKSKQIYLENQIDSISFDCKKIAILLNSNSEICALAGNTQLENRQIASTIKPLCIYAPVIENNLVTELSIINDEKVDYNGYSPSNYGNCYYGNISVKDALAKSSNTVAIKLLNYLGVENANNYLKKMNFDITKEDYNLSIGLGAITNGIKLDNLVSAYQTFANDGFFKKPTIINKIVDINNKIIYKKEDSYNKIFGSDTCQIINDMLTETATNGTAKKIYSNKYNICAKTGTNGNSKGNIDAYTVSYTKDYALGFWIGNNNELLSNKVTGGSYPAVLSKNIWDNIYKNSLPSNFNKSYNVLEVKLDKDEYEKSKLVLADDIAPDKYTIKGLFKSETIPIEKSTKFSFPSIDYDFKTLVNNEQISIKLCQTEPYNLMIEKCYDNKKEVIFDSTNNTSLIFYDNNLIDGKTYQYIITPYYFDGKNKYFGKEIILPKIKYSCKNSLINEEWWLDY